MSTMMPEFINSKRIDVKINYYFEANSLSYRMEKLSLAMRFLIKYPKSTWPSFIFSFLIFNKLPLFTHSKQSTFSPSVQEHRIMALFNLKLLPNLLNINWMPFHNYFRNECFYYQFTVYLTIREIVAEREKKMIRMKNSKRIVFTKNFHSLAPFHTPTHTLNLRASLISACCAST